MPTDASIITNFKQPDIGAQAAQLVNMQSLGLKNQQAQQQFDDQQALRTAQEKNTSIDPNTGQASINMRGIANALADSGRAHLVPSMQIQQHEAQAKALHDQLDMQGQLAGMAQESQAGLDRAHQIGQQLGYDTSQFPTTLDDAAKEKLKSFQMMALNNKEQIAARAEQLGLKIKEKESNIKSSQFGRDIRKDSATQNQETLSALQALRGNPALQRAETNVLASKNINDLAEQFRDPKTGKINLNNANPQQISLFNHELLRAATGGTGSEADLENLKPGTPQYRFAEIRQKLTGKVSGADAAPYIQQGLDYANTLSKTAGQFLYQNAKHVVDSKRRYLAPEDAKHYDQQLNDMKSGKAYFGDIIGSPTSKNNGQQSSSFPPDVVSYAQKHGITPEQAQSIKTQRNMGAR